MKGFGVIGIFKGWIGRIYGVELLSCLTLFKMSSVVLVGFKRFEMALKYFRI